MGEPLLIRVQERNGSHRSTSFRFGRPRELLAELGNVSGKAQLDAKKEIEMFAAKSLDGKWRASKERGRAWARRLTLAWVRQLWRGEPAVGSQSAALRGASRALFAVGCLIGLSPVSGALGNDVSNVRFDIASFKSMYNVTLCLLQAFVTALSVVHIFKTSVTIFSLGLAVFYGSTCVTSVLFLRLATQWHLLRRQVTSAGLDQFAEPRIQLKCTCVVAVIFTLALLEHALLIARRQDHLTDCVMEEDNTYKTYVEINFPWLSYLGISGSVLIFVLITLLNVVCTLNWNYSHVFVICMSLYLSGVLEQINEKLLAAEGQPRPARFWRELREQYTSAARVVRAFDRRMGGVVLLSFASNLFFVCLQLFYVLSSGLTSSAITDKSYLNHGSGRRCGGESRVYVSFSAAFVLARSLAVALAASRVHSASLAVAPVLYAVPSVAYCVEVQRFIEQVHGDSVALTGLDFFRVTRELVLSVAGTIVTYELVLLQFT